jgi:hypothetical protein
MSDTPSAYPPPPPSTGMPQAATPPPPVYQGPAAPDYVQPYLQPPQQPHAVVPMAAGGAAILYQLGGPAAWSIGFGLVSIVVPLVTDYYFPILPIAGGLGAIQAIRRGRVIGGVIGIVLNLIGGLVSLLASGLMGG